MLFLAFDFGTTHIGVAIGQNITCTASVLQSIKVKNGMPNFFIIRNILLKWKPQLVVIGYPLNMDGTKQKITKKVEQFSKLIKLKFNILVYLHDERLSTVEAKSYIFKKYGYKGLTKENINAFSAVIILESWLKTFIK